MKRLPVIVFSVILLMLVVVLFTPSSETSAPTPQVSPSVTPLPANIPQTSIWIEPTPVAKVMQDGTVPLELYIKSQQNLVTRVQLEFQYDPKVLQYVSIAGADYLGGKPILEKTINQSTGRITFAVGLGAKDVPIQGTDAIAHVVFRPLLPLNGQKTEVKLLPSSTVNGQGATQSVLTDTKGTWVELTKGESKDE